MNLSETDPGIYRQTNVFSFNFIWDALWPRRWLIVGTTLAGLLLGIAYAMIAGQQYTISMTLIPAESDTERAGLLSQLPSFLSPGGDAPVSKFKQFQAAIFSYGVASLMDQRYGSLCRVEVGQCDFITRKWSTRPAWRMSVSTLARSMVGMPPKPATPQTGDLVRYIQSNVTVNTDKTSLTTLTMVSPSPEMGKEFLSNLVTATNDYVRVKDRGALRQYVDYLSNRLGHLNSVDQRSALDELLLTEERRLMLTEVNVPYAAATLDGPNAVASNAVMKLTIGLLVGFLLGCCGALVATFFGSRLPGKRVRIQTNSHQTG